MKRTLSIIALVLVVALVVVCLVLLMTPSANAAPRTTGYSIDWWTIDGGGGTSTSGAGTYTLTGTIGQPDAGPALTSTTYSLQGGFWNTALGDLVKLFLPLIRR